MTRPSPVFAGHGCLRYGWREIFTSSVAISGGERTRSIIPVAMAARGMPSYFAVSGTWAMVMPPTALISRTPMAPSDAVPERITPIARFSAE